MGNKILLLSGASSNVFPPVPTREQICGVKLTFEGLTIITNQYGARPWFEVILASLTNVDDRVSVYNQKKLAGDTHQIVEFFTDEQWANPANRGWPWGIIPSAEQNPLQFLALVEEVILNGLIPIVAFDGDDGDDTGKPSWVHGHHNAMRQLPILVNLLASSRYGDLNKYVLYARLWDSVFYGSTPEQIGEFGVAFRNLLPDGHLAIEHNFGHIPTGEGDEDWVAGGRMTTYDVILSEFDYPPANDTIWQIAGRLLGPAYVRPPDQPEGDDPHPPFYLREGNPRGQYYAVAFETWGEYFWVRVGDPFAPAGLELQREIQTGRAYLKSVGYKFTG